MEDFSRRRRHPDADLCARRTLRLDVFIASDLAAIVIVVVMTVLVVVSVLGLHVWGAIQDGREEKEMRALRHPDGRQNRERHRGD